MAIAISLESSELLEHFLYLTAATRGSMQKRGPMPIKEEMAGIAIFLFELADNSGRSALRDHLEVGP